MDNTRADPDLVRTAVATEPGSGARPSLDAAREATRRLQALIARDRAGDTRDSRELQDALYDEDGLPK